MAGKPFRVPFHIKVNRFFLKPIFRMLYRILGQITITGLENVPLGTPYIVAFNHISIFDPPLVTAFWHEQVEVIGAADVFEKKVQGPLLRMYGVIPVHRGEYDRSLLEKVLLILKSGRSLVMAPEGGRSHQPAMRRALPGIGYIIEHAQVPVIPVGLVGTTDDFWQRARRGEHPHLEMRVGKPICFDPVTHKGIERKEIRQRNADLVMRTIAGLLPKEYHGVYAGQAIPPT